MNSNLSKGVKIMNNQSLLEKEVRGVNIQERECIILKKQVLLMFNFCRHIEENEN